ncbi:MAG: cation:proton antiporter [Acidobacteriaceae bacterium]|nr:cation:proton antiporter [Acidobacteriaceae bacterium]
MNDTGAHLTHLFVELGCAIVGLAILARIGNRLGFSAIPLYLIAGLAFGTGGVAPLPFTENFIHVGAEIGVLLLLFMLGLEYTGEELAHNLRAGFWPGVIDLILNFPPGFFAGRLLGWTVLPCVLLGGVTYVSSSGIIAKVLGELGRLGNPETPPVLTVLVLEDLAMAVFLPTVGGLLVGGGPARVAISVAVAVAAVTVVLFVALRYGQSLSRFVAHESDEIILLTILGTVLLVAGVAERFRVSAAIGAFLVGIAASGPVAQQAHRIFAPLRDLFAATFFFFFGLEIDPSTLTHGLPFCLGLAVVTAGTKLLTGYWAARKTSNRRAQIRAGAALIARGEFSIVIAGLGVGLEPGLGPVSATYVLIMAIFGPIAARLAKQ